MRYKYNISNLDCANCATKIEKELNKDKNIVNANVNFSSMKLSFEMNIDEDALSYVSKIVRKVEPQVVISENKKSEDKSNNDIIRLICGVLIGVAALIMPLNDLASMMLLVFSYIILLSKTFMRALKLLYRSKTINENFLITISCIGAFIINKPSEGLMVIVLYEIGKILEAKAINNSRKSISSLMDIKPEYANLKSNDVITVVDPLSIKINDIIVIKEGEKIPLDGVVVKGEAKLNMAALTGESSLKSVKINDNVLSGSVNGSGLIEVKVAAIYENSTVKKILDLVENATDKKAKTETFVSKAARVYTPTVFILAILLMIFGTLLSSIPFAEWFYKALVFLVISCPCAIAISVPLSYFAGIGKASKEGILIKGSNYLDILKDIKTMFFDKTGTITTGKFDEVNLTILSNSFSEKEVIELYVKGEELSNHPLAKSIVSLSSTKISTKDVKNYKEHPGQGISYVISTKKVLIGNAKFCKSSTKDSSIYLNYDGNIIAKIDMTDKPKTDAKESIQKLKNNGIHCMMLTGDNEIVAKRISKEVNMDGVNYELLPDDKYTILDNYIRETKGVTSFVGDGINDAPVLALADVGISMGGVGTASAIEASDVVIMNDELSKINDAIEISKYTNKVIKQNLIFAISTKILVLLLSAFGIANMWQAVFADVGVTLLTILNTTRILKK